MTATDDHFKNTKSLILVLAMPGCPACEDYKPRFEKMVAGFKAYGVPFHYYDNTAPPPGSIPVLIVDATSPDPRIQQFCDGNKIQNMPTTMLFQRYGRPSQLEGALDDQQIFDLLTKAVYLNK